MAKAKGKQRDARIPTSSKPRKRIKPPKPPQEPAPDAPILGKRTRKDVSDRKQARRLHQQYVVKASFPGTLSVFLPETVREAFREVVDDYVACISKMLVSGSMVANETILELFRRGHDVKVEDYLFFRRAMTSKATVTDPIMQDVLNTHFQDLQVERSVGDWASVNFASQKFYTDFDNNLWMSFIPRYVGYVCDYAERFDFDLPRVVASTICGFRCHVQCALNRTAWEFIEDQRRLLSYPEYLVPQRTCGDLLLRILYRILDFRHTYGLSGGFSLVPINKVKRHHITIDTTALYLILSRIFAKLGERTPMWMQEIVLLEENQAIHSYRDMMWGMMFDNFSVLSNGEFIHTIVTDRVSVSVNFQRPRREGPVGEDLHILTPACQTDAESERRIAFDPGRHHLLVGHEVTPDGKDRYWTLSRGAYYGAIRQPIQRMARWERNALGDVYAEMSTTSIKTADPELRAAYRRLYFNHYNRLWAVKLHKRFAREKLHIYSKKRSTIDKFFMSLIRNDRRRPVILYGASTFRSGGVGELSVPVKRILQHANGFIV